MSASAAVLVRRWEVGNYVCTMTIPPPQPNGVRAVVIEWEPEVPSQLTMSEINQYRDGRNAAIRSMGIRALVVDI